MVSGMIPGGRVLSLLVGLCFFGAGSASAAEQEISRQSVLAAPPPITFPDWKQVDENDVSTEYLESFPSSVVTKYPANNVVPLQVFLPVDRQGPVPVVLITHYWGARDLRAEETLAQDLNDRGLGAAILVLPYHLMRTPPGHLSGDLAIVPDPEKLKETMFQAEQDVRRAIAFLDTRPEVRHDGYGLVGTSLGAIVAGLAYAVEPRIKEAAFVLGGADLARIIWSSSRVVQVRDQLRRSGWTEDRLRKVLAPVEPLNYLPRAEAGATFVIYGRYDTVVPDECTRALIGHLSDPKTVEIETGHYGGLFVKGKVLRTVSDFFAAQMSGRSFVPPARLIAPTIRFGALVDTPAEVNLAAGLDLVHFDRLATNFASLFATPRGLRLFVGHHLGQGFSLGAVGSGRGIGVGFVWSTVL